MREHLSMLHQAVLQNDRKDAEKRGEMGARDPNRPVKCEEVYKENQRLCAGRQGQNGWAGQGGCPQHVIKGVIYAARIFVTNDVEGVVRHTVSVRGNRNTSRKQFGKFSILVPIITSPRKLS